MFGYCNFEYVRFTKFRMTRYNGSLAISIKPKGSVTFAMNVTMILLHYLNNMDLQDHAFPEENLDSKYYVTTVKLV
jgi:hypothetical protein